MSTLSAAYPNTDLDWPYRGDARAWALLAEVLDGKLDVQTLCERQGMRRDEVQGWLRERHRSALMAFDDQLKRALIRQGASPEALVGPELGMSLADVSVIDWIQAIQIFAKQAIITILHDEGESRIWFSRGALVDAVSGRLNGEAAVYRIATLERGQMVTELRAVHRERTIRTSTAWLLLEAVRRKDESSQLRRKLGSLDRYFQGVADGGVLNRSLNSSEAALLRLFDEPRRLMDVLARSEMGDVETLAALESLIRSEHLVEADPVSQQRLRALGGREASTQREAALAWPIAFAWPRERVVRRGTWRWVASTVLMGSLVSSAAWLGAQMSSERSLLASASRVLPEPAATTYPVIVRAYPADAELQVDGRVVGQGFWTTRLAKDGVVHELRASAPGFVPTRIVFIDTAPPMDVRLEPVAAEPTLALADSDLPPTTSREPAEPPAAATVPQRASSPRRKRPPAANALKSPSPIAPAADGTASARSKPYVQVIDTEESRALPN
jgi:hypothetical protein